jgi:hypothetical protein
VKFIFLFTYYYDYYVSALFYFSTCFSFLDSFFQEPFASISPLCSVLYNSKPLEAVLSTFVAAFESTLPLTTFFCLFGDIFFCPNDICKN